ncbi:MAG: hypothetical protein Q7T69_12935 [Rhodoferax sp.]|nr:hypothetical protein [Rhodoferax sp.]
MKTHIRMLASVLVCLCCIGGASGAATSCHADALDSAGYVRAIQSVRELPELVQWSRSHRFPVAFGESMDKQLRLRGRCYWSVSVYANRPERMELWQIFYVEANGKRMLVQDPVSGVAISLEKWRSQSDRSRMV